MLYVYTHALSIYTHALYVIIVIISSINLVVEKWTHHRQRSKIVYIGYLSMLKLLFLHPPRGALPR